MMTVTVNGEDMTMRPDASVAELLRSMGLPDRGIAVAVDGVVVPRGSWSTALHAGAGVEIVTAVQGG